MEIIRKFRRVTVIEYGLFYEDKEDLGSGYSFPCDENGNILEKEMNVERQESLQKCLKEKERRLPVLQKYEHSYPLHAIGRCSCGQEVELYCDANECNCGRLYNLFGQALAPYSQWKDDWNEVCY